MKKYFGVTKSKKFTKNTLRICCGYAIIIRDLSFDNIYQLLFAFDQVYYPATEAERKDFMRAFVERIEIYPEKRKDGCQIKKIVFIFPLPVDGKNVTELPLELETTVESVVCLTRRLDNELRERMN